MSEVVDIVPDIVGTRFLTEAQGKMIDDSLTKAVFESEHLDSLHFDFAGFDRGRFRLLCANTRTKDWLLSIIPNLQGLWKDAKIKAVCNGPPPKMVKAKMLVPLPTMEPNDVLNGIGIQNKPVNTTHWRFYKRSEPRNGREIWFFAIDENSIRPLRAKNFTVYCGITEYRILILNAQNP